MANKYLVTLKSNQTAIVVTEMIQAADYVEAISKAKTIMTTVNKAGGGVPDDFRVQGVHFDSEVTA